MFLPPLSIAVLVATGGCFALAFTWQRYGQTRLVILPVLAAALLISGFAASDLVLHPWDERFHALVAKHLITHPFLPTLYDRPALPYDYRDWMTNHVWLHKPPVGLWVPALSMRLFGVHEWALRLPSVLMLTLGVALTFRIGCEIFDQRTALLASMFHSVNGFLVSMAAGRRADHIDTLLVVLVQLGVLLALSQAHRPSRLTVVWLGILSGVAVLTKSMAGMLILPILFYVVWSRQSIHKAVTTVALTGTIALALAGPWYLYTRLAFPVEAAWEAAYTWRHIYEVLEGHAGTLFFYLADMPRTFGELIYLPVGWFLVQLVRGRGDAGWRAVAVWIGTPYVLFSLFATKLPTYVLVAAPAVFLVEARFWWELKRFVGEVMDRYWRRVGLVLLGILLILPARYLMEPTGPLESREWNPEWAQSLRDLPGRIGVSDAVIFNSAAPIETMFYTSYTAYDYLPTWKQVDSLREQGLSVVIIDDGRDALDIPPSWDVTILREGSSGGGS